MLRLRRVSSYNTILCVEPFGCLLGVQIAYERACSIVLTRRAGKLPRSLIQRGYSLRHHTARHMEIHKGALPPKSRTLLVDDFLISDGTIAAALESIARAESDAAVVVCVVENTSCRARTPLRGHGVPSVTVVTIS